jgi:DNA invertase Pin-like site-specific DNA recombinase
MRTNYLSIAQIQSWLQAHQKRLQYGDLVIPISAIAIKAGISRQTLYAVLNGERAEFGQVAQIRLSRVIQEITSHPDYQVSRMMRLDLSGVAPRIRFGI